MYAVVLVGGFGTRLRPLTNRVPKPMLPVGHRPMIVSLVDRLGKAGVSDVVLALGFRPEPFEAAFPGGRHGDVHMHYAVEPTPLDTGGAIAFAARSAGIADTFFVLNGDIICDVNLAELAQAHRASGLAATIHLTPVADPSAFGVVEADDAGLVERFVEKPAPGETDSNLISAGTYVFEPGVLDLIEPDRPVSVEREVFPRLVADRALGAFATEDYWLDAGRPELYLEANLDLISGRRGSSTVGVHADATIDDRAIVVESVVGPGVVVEPGATVTRSVLLEAAHVGADATIESSIVAGQVGARASVHRSVVGAEGVVQPDDSLVDARLPAP